MSNPFDRNTTADDAATYFASAIAGKTVLITGCTIGGLGFEAARATSQHHPALLVLAGRTVAKLDDAKTAILKATPSANVRVLVVDFGSLASVRAAAAEVNNYPEPIDVLINNIAIVQPFAVTPDGFDRTFETNYLGTFLFTNLVKGRILAAKEPRVVTVSSAGHHRSALDLATYGKPDEATFDKWDAYAKTKTACLLFNTELAKRWAGDGVVAVSLHPGVIKTGYVTSDTPQELVALGMADLVDENGELGNTSHWKSIAQGAATHIVAAFDPKLKNASGSYLVDGNVAPDQVAPYATDRVQAAKLWELSEGWVGQKF